MIKLSCRLSVWQKSQGHFTNYQFLVKSTQQKTQGQTIGENHDQTSWCSQKLRGIHNL